MPNKMERFSEKSRRVLALAQDEAERLHHNYIGIEHLLLGLIREEGGVARRALEDLGLRQYHIAEVVERISPPGDSVPNSRLDLTADTKKTLELAVDEARRSGFHYVGTEHLLLGLVRITDCKGTEVLARLNVSPQEVERHTRQVLQEALATFKQSKPELSITKASAEVDPDSVVKSESEPAFRLAGTAHAALFFALAEAKRMQRSTANTAYLLLGMLTDEWGAAGRLLRSLGLDSEQVHELVKQTSPSLPEPPEQVRFAPDAINAIGTAVEESILAGNPYVRTEHLLLAIVRQKESSALDILKQLNISPEQIEKAVRDTLM